jgi:chromosome segregation ATPase
MRQGQGIENRELRRRLEEEEQLRRAADSASEILQDQLRVLGQRAEELQARNEAFEGMDTQLREKLAEKEQEVVGLKSSLQDSELGRRTEETERIKVVDKMRRKEIEITKAGETIGNLTTQLQRVGAERDTLHAQVGSRAGVRISGASSPLNPKPQTLNSKQ